MSDMTGQIIGNYRLIAPLGDDGRVARYRTTDPLTGQALVLTLLPDDPNAPVRDLARIATLTGPHIVPILDWGTVDGWRYLALPELRGGDVRRSLASGAQAPGAAIELVRQAASGVGYAHARGIVHGELRPERLLLDETGPERGVGGWVRVALFGLGAGEPVAEARPYAAPERLRGEPPSARADVYALGAILGEALSSQIRTINDTHNRDMSRGRGSSLPPALDAILRRCLAAAPADRYADANELATALRAAADELVGAASAPDPALAVTLLPATLLLTPGEPAAVRVALGNGTGTSQHLTLAFEGTPAGWLAGVPGEVLVAPGTVEEVELTITATRDAHEPAGEYPVIVRANPRAGDTVAAHVRTIWTLCPFAAGTLTLTPTAARDVQTVRLHNQGNASQRHTLSVSAAAPLTAAITPATLDLDPDERATATVQLATPRRLIGRTTAGAFAVEARVAGAEPLRATGSFVQPARVPFWALPVALLVLLALACGIAYAAYPQAPAALGFPSPVPTMIAALDPTTTAVPAAVTATSSTASATAGDTPRTPTAPRPAEPLTLSVTRLDFGSVPIGGNSVQTLQIKNVSGRPVTFASIQITGSADSDFTRAGPCGLEALDTALNCPLTIIFTPGGLGTREARLEVTPAGGATQFVALIGISATMPVGTPQLVPPASVPPLAGARSGQAAAALADGRRLLVSGGRNGQNLLKSTEVYDLATNAWSSTRDMSVPRVGHTATTLPDGTVVVIGGRGSGGPLRTAEVYDPATGTWSPFAPLTTAREGHSATVLVDGRTKGYQILVLGGLDQDGTVLTSGERYDSTTNTWTRLARLIPDGRARHTATLIPTIDSETPRILIVGGVTASGDPAPAQLFDPSGDGSWRLVEGEPAGLLARTDFTATRVATTGQIMFIGGLSENTESGAIISYDPATGRWGQPSEELTSGRAGQSATFLAYGRILLVGGRQGGRETATTVLLDPALFAVPAPTPTPAETPTPTPTATPIPTPRRGTHADAGADAGADRYGGGRRACRRGIARAVSAAAPLACAILPTKDSPPGAETAPRLRRAARREQGGSDGPAALPECHRADDESGAAAGRGGADR